MNQTNTVAPMTSNCSPNYLKLLPFLPSPACCFFTFITMELLLYWAASLGNLQAPCSFGYSNNSSYLIRTSLLIPVHPGHSFSICGFQWKQKGECLAKTFNFPALATLRALHDFPCVHWWRLSYTLIGSCASWGEVSMTSRQPAGRRAAAAATVVADLARGGG